MTKASRADAIRKYLAGEGYAPSLDSDGDVRVKFEGLTMYVELIETDEIYYRIVLPSFWSIENEADRAKAIAAANDVTRDLKAAKILVIRDSVWATIETFYPSVEQMLPVLVRNLNATLAAAMKFGRIVMGA